MHVEVADSHEEQDFGYALETAGGIVRALPLLDDVFWVLAGDVYAPDFVYTQASVDRFLASGILAHLWLVPNSQHHPAGDFGLSAQGLALSRAEVQYTFSTIALYRCGVPSRAACRDAWHLRHAAGVTRLNCPAPPAARAWPCRHPRQR